MKGGGVYASGRARTFYEDELVCCMLEAWPRNPGHSIVLVKPHFEDLSVMPLAVAAKVLPVILAATGALKATLGAEKVYLCTMCDGQRNHLHFQLIPRMPGDPITGSKLFVKDRACVEDWADLVQELRCATRERLQKGSGLAKE
jgi:diadenosine tetraphosphate (Ap4A) HIT family hydrolase